MMGAVLVRPQRVRRAQAADPATLLASELASLGTRLVMDAEQGGHIAETAQAAAEQAIRDLMDARLAAAQAAMPRLADWLLRVVKALTGIGPDLQVGTPAEGIELARTMVERAGSAAQNATAERIRPYVAELLDIIQVELGLSLPAIETMVWEIADDVIDRLEALPPEPQRTARENRLDTIRMLRRIKKLIRGRFPLPVVDADRIADAIAAALRRMNAAAVGRHAACVSEAIGAISDAAHGIDELVPLGISQFGSLGAAAAATTESEKYCWYASWLLGDDVVINAPRSEIRKGDEVIATGTNLGIADIPQFRASTTPHYTFTDALNPETMEVIAYATYVAADGIDVVCHLASLEQGDRANNALNAFYFSFVGVGKVFLGRPMMPTAVESYVLPLFLSSLASFEGMHTKASAKNWAAMWSTLLVPDMIETVIYRTASSMAKDGVLSLLTLANYKGDFYSSADPDPRPLNREHIEGIVALPGLAWGKLQFSASVFPREEYAPLGSSKDHTLKQIFYWDMLIGTCFGLLSRLTGCLLAMAISRTFDPIAWAKGMWRIPVAWVTWFISLYMAVEGDTDDGKFNHGGDPFSGYPKEREASPYTLPYPKDQVVYVIQGNQGLFSHHHLNVKQTYSYDFSMDQDDIILASRPGTVVDYFDWVPDDTNPDSAEMTAAKNEAVASGFLITNPPPAKSQTDVDSWNFIAIRHDCDDAGSALDPDDKHDRGPAGAKVTTYAIYGHGRKGSVRELFGARGVAENAIIGTTVKRGDRIMRSGDTGISFNNHLHMMVQAGPDRTVPVPVPRQDLATPTIPFVFKDVEDDGGRCKSLNFYESTTVDLQAAP